MEPLLENMSDRDNSIYHYSTKAGEYWEEVTTLLLYKPAVQWNGLCLHEELGEKMRLGRIENLRKDGKEDEKCEGFWIERKINVLTMRAGEVACERSLKIEGLGT